MKEMNKPVDPNSHLSAIQWRSGLPIFEKNKVEMITSKHLHEMDPHCL